MNKSMEILAEVLGKNEDLVVDGMLDKNMVAELARKYDKGLLTALCRNKNLKELFFEDIDGQLVFKKDIFLQFISQKEFLPDSYTRFSQKIGLATANGDLLSNDNRVVLNWPYKDCVLEGGQTKEDQKRDEVFFNEILAPDQISTILEDKVFTNWKRYDKDGERKLDKLNPNDNLIIKGNNLVVLHSLKKRFSGRIKLIYIDPPYNTKSDSFGYNDNFKHSTWLTFMKNRLEAAYDLLSKDGILCVQCDDHEQAYLKVLLDEIFGQDNLINTIAVKMSTASGMKTAHREKTIVKTKEYIHIFAKQSTMVKIHPQYVLKDKFDDEYGFYLEKNGSENIENWRIKKLDDKLKELNISTKKDLKDPSFKKFYLENADLIWARGRHHNIPVETFNKSNEDRDHVFSYQGSDGIQYAYRGRRLAFLSKTIHKCLGDDGNITDDIATLSADFWHEVSTAALFNEGGVDLPNGKKPEYLLYKLISLFTDESDIVMDYHLGSGTTAAVAHKMGRQYIGIEQLYYGDNDSVERLKNVINGDQTGISKAVEWQGGGSFVYCNIKNDANIFREKVVSAKEADLSKLLDEVLKSSFLSYRVDPKKVNKKEFEELSLADKKRILCSLVDNNTLYMNYSEIDDASYDNSAEDKKFNKQFYTEID